MAYVINLPPPHPSPAERGREKTNSRTAAKG